MLFQTPREGDRVHMSAVRRLGEARDERIRLAEALAASQGTPAERGAARELAAARAGVAAREAWLVWVERNV
jgi:hypothetical protein